MATIVLVVVLVRFRATSLKTAQGFVVSNRTWMKFVYVCGHQLIGGADAYVRDELAVVE